MAERRNDLGFKIFVGLVIGIITIPITFYLSAGMSVAREADKKADNAATKVAVVEERQSGFEDSVGKFIVRQEKVNNKVLDKLDLLMDRR